MGVPIVTAGAKTTHGGQIIECTTTFKIHGVGIHVDGMQHYCPKCKTTVSAIASNQTKKIHGKAMVLDGDLTTCGAKFIATQSKAFIGGGGSSDAAESTPESNSDTDDCSTVGDVYSVEDDDDSGFCGGNDYSDPNNQFITETRDKNGNVVGFEGVPRETELKDPNKEDVFQKYWNTPSPPLQGQVPEKGPYAPTEEDGYTGGYSRNIHGLEGKVGDATVFGATEFAKGASNFSPLVKKALTASQSGQGFEDTVNKEVDKKIEKVTLATISQLVPGTSKVIGIYQKGKKVKSNVNKVKKITGGPNE